jgi:SAM-dependent methyltransferase
VTLLYDQDRHIAEIYDITESYSDDVDLLRWLLGNSGPLHIREPFCGTGRIAIPLAEDGHSLVGTDISEGMVARAIAKTNSLPTNVQNRLSFGVEDALASPWGTGFDLVILGANCLYELSSATDQAKCIERAADCLKEGGFVYVDNDARKGNVSTKDIGHRSNFPSGVCSDGHKLEGLGEITGIDKERNLWYKKRSLRVVDPAGNESYHEWETHTRPVSMDEVRDWLETTGFQILKLYGSRQRETFDAGSERAIFWAQKQP